MTSAGISEAVRTARDVMSSYSESEAYHAVACQVPWKVRLSGLLVICGVTRLTLSTAFVASRVPWLRAILYPVSLIGTNPSQSKARLNEIALAAPFCCNCSMSLHNPEQYGQVCRTCSCERVVKCLVADLSFVTSAPLVVFRTAVSIASSTVRLSA